MLLGRNCKANKNNVVEKLLSNNVLYDDKKDIADIFNQYFVNVGNKLAYALPQSSTNFYKYLGPIFKIQFLSIPFPRLKYII